MRRSEAFVRSTARRRAKRLAAVALLLATVCTPAAAADDGSGPRLVVRETTDAVLAVLARKELPTATRREKIEAIVYEKFDFLAISRLVLARNWKRFSPEQQEEFVSEFKKHLSITYGNNVDTYNDEKVEITGDRAEARGDWTVKTKIVRTEGEDILVDYRLRRKKEHWRVIDVIIEGVSLVANFRSQFRDLVSRKGADGLITLLREKNERGESFDDNGEAPKKAKTGSG